MTSSKLSKKSKTSWWSEGLRFQCQQSGKCCTSHGEHGFVYVTLEDRKRFAKYLKITTSEFTKTYCQKSDGIFHLIERPDNPDCIFLKNKKQCGAYEARPTQCRTWPFWPENMNAKAWSKELESFCPGVGKGSIIPAPQIKNLLDEQEESNSQLGT